MALKCSLSVNGLPSGEELEATHISPVFSPQLPLVFGRVEDEEMESFIGCISELATNGDTAGFRQVVTFLLADFLIE